jgi:alginate O-acetyltransferase complex protein AlgI
MFKKIVLADNLSVYVDEVFDCPNAFSSVTVFLAVISYSMQIYFDFSGYSDMAIGSARCLGYELPRNFNLPYISQNVSEFWKRWHISLSTWLQEYLYIPLGGNRKGEVRIYINLMVTMLLGGLWHGANWTFVIWGGLHGIALCVHKAYCKIKGKNKEKSFMEKLFSVFVTYCFVDFCWIFFRAESFKVAIALLVRMFTFSKGITHIYTWTFLALMLMVGCTVKAYKNKVKEDSVDGYYQIMDLSRMSSLIYLFVVIGLIIGLAYTGSSPFIYFQF